MAASKTITVEIKADTSQLEEALDRADNSLREIVRQEIALEHHRIAVESLRLARARP